MRLPTALTALAASFTSMAAPAPTEGSSVPSQQTADEIAGPAELNRAALSERIAQILKDAGVAGAHVAVTMGPDTVYSRAFGTNPSTGEAFTDETIVRLASASKLVTALTVAAMVEQGALSLDETLGDLDPDLPEVWRDLPVWRVLNHTSGLPMIVTRPEFGAMEDDRLSRFSIDDLRAIIGEQALDFQPGEQWRYQQSGYALLAHSLAKRAGTTWPQLVEQSLLQPAALKTTGVGNEAKVFQDQDGETVPHISNYPAFFAPAGGFQSTGKDTRQLLLALAQGRVLNEDSVRRLVNDTRRLEQLRGDADGEGYGMGVAVQRFGDIAFFGHSGGGGLVDIRYAPERQMGIAVVTNQAGGTGAAIEIGNLIASKLAGEAHFAAET
ncbi:MAG: serine hydrolase domain-containing protein [Pseudomonadota bacterium]